MFVAIEFASTLLDNARARGDYWSIVAIAFSPCAILLCCLWWCWRCCVQALPAIIAKLEPESPPTLSAPAARRLSANHGNRGACPAASISVASSLPLTLRNGIPDDKSDHEEIIEMLENGMCDAKFRKTYAKLVTSVSTAIPSEPLPTSYEVTPDASSDHHESTVMLNRSCDWELHQALLQLMNLEIAGPFLEDHRDHALGLRTIEQRLNIGRYVDAAGRTRAELFWSDVDACIDICESSGRLPFLVGEMRAFAKLLEQDFWSIHSAYDSLHHTMNPALRTVAAAASVLRSNADNSVHACEGSLHKPRVVRARSLPAILF